MKKMVSVLVCLLAVNFLAAAGGIGWLYQSGHLDRPRIQAIKEVVFPPATQPAEPTTQPTEAPAPSASKQLEDMLAKALRKGSATEQVNIIQEKYGQMMAQLDQRKRELDDRDAQVAEANRRVVEDRKALEAERLALTERSQQTERLAGDKGFQDTLNIYNNMSPKQLKPIFMSWDDTAVARYFDAMEPGRVAKILKEFKTPQEIDRTKLILGKMLQPPVPTTAPTTPTAAAKE